MKLAYQKTWHKLDWWLIFCSAVLVLISLSTLYSLELNQETPDFSLLNRQFTATIIGGAVATVLLFVDFRYFRDYAYIIYCVGIVLLVLVLIIGVTVRGTTGWFNIAGISFQPVELFKPILIITLARFFTSHSNPNSLLTFIQSLAFLLIPGILIYLQPDLGSLIILGVIWIGIIFVMRFSRRNIIIFFFLGIIISITFWMFFLKPYQKERILIFINNSDPMSSGYNVEQSKIAIGSGRWLGRGFGLGTQSSLNFLPEQETDFIFAVIAESLGLLGGGLMVFLYTFLLFRILLVVREVRDDFGVLVGIGIFMWFMFQGYANIAMNLGLAPVFGVPLPFLSYGGSSIVVSLISIGLLESIVLHSRSSQT